MKSHEQSRARGRVSFKKIMKYNSLKIISADPRNKRTDVGIE
jgi:hypothetical protein